MSIKQKRNGIVSLVPIHASEIQISDVKNNFENKNVESALKELKENKADILNKLNDYVSYNKLPDSKDFNDCILDGFYKTNGAMLNLDGRMFIGPNTLGLHEESTEGMLKVCNFSDMYIEQTFSSIYGFTVQRAKVNGVWSEWKQLATTDKVINFINKGQTVSDANLLYKAGLYRCSSWINIPSNPDGQGLLEVKLYSTGGNGGWFSQTFISPHLNKRYIRSCINGAFSPWEQLATTEVKEIILLNGWKLENGEAIATRIGNKVFLDLTVTGGSGGGLPIFELPFFIKTDQIWNITVQNDKWEMIAQNVSTGGGSLNYWGTPTKRVPIHISYTTNV